MALAVHGLNNGEISAKLTVSPATTKTHISRAMSKLGARDRAQLVVLAYESGLVVPCRARNAPTSADPDGPWRLGAVTCAPISSGGPNRTEPNRAGRRDADRPDPPS